METLNLLARYSLLVLLIISDVSSKGKIDDTEKTLETNNKGDKSDENIGLNQGNEHIGFESQLKKDLKVIESSKFCDKEKEDCNEASSLPLNNEETIAEDFDNIVEPNIDRKEKKVSSPELELRTKASTDVKDDKFISKDQSLEIETEESGSKDDRDAEISDTKSVMTENEEVLLEAKSEEGNTEPMKNVSNSESNSTLYQWLKFILDPFIEEFKDGIYPKLSDKTNITLSNVSVVNESITVKNETVNVTIAEPKNMTETENNTTDTGRKVKFQCTGKNATENTNATVKLITTAQLLQLLNFDKNDTENVTDCLLVMFYAPWCHFCAKVAPHYNALARAFPQLEFVAVDTAQFSNLLARFGTVSVPNILVFHQSRAAVKFNQTDRTFENFVTFVTNSTGLEANSTVNITDADYAGPVPSVPTNEPDFLLLVSWLFVIFCSSCMFVKSNKGQQWINRVRILWQEHQHID